MSAYIEMTRCPVRPFTFGLAAGFSNGSTYGLSDYICFNYECGKMFIKITQFGNKKVIILVLIFVTFIGEL